jgi:hypothetical protein
MHCTPKAILMRHFGKLFVWPCAKLSISLLQALLLLVISSTTAHAQTSPYANALQKAKYQVFTADVNGDGSPDYLLKSTPSVIMLPLDDDDSFPLTFFAGSKTFAISSGAQNSNAIALGPNAGLELNPSL